MAAPPRCRSLGRRGTPLPQWPPPPGQTKLAMTDPAELVTCDQTIERRIAYIKLGRHVRIAPGDLDAFIRAGRVEVGVVPLPHRVGRRVG